MLAPLSRTERIQPVNAGEGERSVPVGSGKQGGTAGFGSSLAVESRSPRSNNRDVPNRAIPTAATGA